MKYEVVYYDNDDDAFPHKETLSAEDCVALTYSKIIVSIKEAEEKGGDESHG